MKHTNFLRGAALALVAVFSIGTAQAASIDGVLSFGGQAVAIPGPGIGDAVGVSFISGFFVVSASGSFDDAGIGVGDTGALADFFFNPLMPVPVNPLLAIGGFSYSLESVSIVDQSDMFLVLSGTGTLSGPGLDDTPYDFLMSIDGVPGGLFAFSGTISAVPVPGALFLLMSGLAALGIRRRV